MVIVETYERQLIMPRTRLGALRSIAAVAGVMILVIPALPVQACEIPVYHYALENWEPDPYEVLVFHRGELSSSEREAVDLLRAGADHRRGHGNLIVQTVDLDTNRDAMMVQRWGEQATTELPWVAAYYPQIRRIPRPAWAGPLKAGDVRALLDSPLRQKIARELASRVTASWILLESGDRGKDNAAWQLLERELRRLEDTLVLPVLEGWGPDGAANEPEDVKFTMHRLSRDSSTERMLVNMLLHSEPDLQTDFAREPLVFPIYGRGLILYALAGPGINEWTITQAAEFLTGPCSCQVKASNPGTDMLVQLNWDSVVRQTAQERMPPPAGMAGFRDRAAEAERRLAEADGAPAAGERRTLSNLQQQGAAATAPTQAAEPRTPTPRTSSRLTQPRTPQRTETPREAQAERPRTREAPRPPDSTGEAPASDTEAGQGEPMGPPDPGEIDAQISEDEREFDPEMEPVIEPEFREELDDEAQLAATTRGDADSNRGAAGLVAVLALIAAAITALVAAIVVRSRQRAIGDEEHEHIPT